MDIGGAVRVAVQDSRAGDRTLVHRQLGILNPPTPPESADIEIRFVDRSPRRHVTLIGAHDSGFSSDEFLMWGDGPVSVSMRQPLPLRMEVPHGAGAIPGLVDLVSAAALLKGYVPLHASAFRWADRGVLVAGWAKGGKTEALLSFMERGATYVGDEWLFMSPEETQVGGIPEPMRIWDWHLEELPQLRRRLGRASRMRLMALEGVERSMRNKWFPMERVADLVNRQRYVRLDPARAFGRERCVTRSPIDMLFLMVSSQSPDVSVDTADRETAARRLATSTAFEHLRLLGTELKQRFAFPELGTPFWDALSATTEVLVKRIADLPAYQVTHPYPAPTAALFSAMRPVVEDVGQ